MDTPSDEPDELESHLAAVQKFRRDRVALFHADRAAWEEDNRRIDARWAHIKTVSFDKNDPNCVPDDYRYADLCPPESEFDGELKFPIDEWKDPCS
jgi:hypothetical protein